MHLHASSAPCAAVLFLTFAILVASPGIHCLAHAHEELGDDSEQCEVCLALVHSMATQSDVATLHPCLEKYSEDPPSPEARIVFSDWVLLPTSRGPPVST